MAGTATTPPAREPAVNGFAGNLARASDERLIALMRGGSDSAFEALVSRYRSPLLAHCRRMMNGDGEDVLQEVFLSAYYAIRADERPIAARPWLYTLAHNRCVSHLRRQNGEEHEGLSAIAPREGETASEAVQRREELRQLVSDIRALPSTQRTALVLREMEARSYEQIAIAMDRTVPSVKSLLVRARTSLLEMAEQRELSCADVRIALHQAMDANGRLRPPVRRHLRSCKSCHTYRSTRRGSTRSVAAFAFPLGLSVGARKLLANLFGHQGASAATAKGTVGGSAAAGGSTAAGGTAAGGTAIAGGLGPTGLLSIGGGTLASKIAGGLIVAAVAAAGGAEIENAVDQREAPHPFAAAEDERAGSPARAVEPPSEPSVPRDRASAAAASDGGGSGVDSNNPPVGAPQVAAEESVERPPAAAPPPEPDDGKTEAKRRRSALLALLLIRRAHEARAAESGDSCADGDESSTDGEATAEPCPSEGEPGASADSGSAEGSGGDAGSASAGSETVEGPLADDSTAPTKKKPRWRRRRAA